jgi:hypothetical protein
MRETKKGIFIALVKAGNPGVGAYNEMTNLCVSRPDSIPFRTWVHQTSWSLSAIVALFRYQCQYLNGDLDWEEFEDLYGIFKSKIASCS